MLCEMVEKREKQKLKQSRILKDALLSILFPHDAALEACLEKISRSVFAARVSLVDTAAESALLASFSATTRERYSPIPSLAPRFRTTTT